MEWTRSPVSSIQIVYLGWIYGSSRGSGRSRSLKGSSIDFFVTKILFFNLFRYCSGNGKLLYSSMTSFPLSSLSGNAEKQNQDFYNTGDPPVTRILGLLQIRVIGKSCYRRSFKYYFTIKRDFWIFKVHFLSFLLLIITPKTHTKLIEWSNMSTKCQSNPQRTRNIFRLFFRF